MPDSAVLVSLVAEIYQPADLIQSFLNAYTLCTPKQTYIENLLRDEYQSSEYESFSMDFEKLIGWPDGEAQLRSLLATAPDDDAALVRATAFLTASAKKIRQRHATEFSRYRSSAYHASAPFGGDLFWIVIDKPRLLTQSVAKKPRDPETVDSTICRYHDGLLVTPVHPGEWHLKEFSLKRIAAKGGTNSLLRKRAVAGTLRLAVSPISNTATLHGKSQRRKPPHLRYAFHVTSIKPLEAEKAALLAVLREAYTRGAAILVLPELRMSPPLLDVVRDFLANEQIIERSSRGLLLVAAGSWHIEQAGGRRWNRCAVLNHEGMDLWTHDKLRKFQFTAANVNAASEFYARLGVKGGDGDEAVHMGTELQFYDSPVGRIAAAICIGFFSPEVEPLLKASGADLFLVPAMTGRTRDLKDRAGALVRSQHAFTLMANCGAMGAQAPSFIHRPAANAEPIEDNGSSLILLV